MIPGITAARLSGARHRAELPLLVLGPSLGTSADALWTACAPDLTDVFDVLAWDLPGHGHNRTVPAEPFTMAELAAGVLGVVDDVLAERGELKGGFYYAGDSVGGCVGLQLMLDSPRRVAAAVLLCTGARIGSPEMWAGRRGQVNVSGTAVMVAGSAERWFAPGFLDAEPQRGAALLEALRRTDGGGYVQVCAALAEFDVRGRLREIGVPVLAVAGALDVATPPALLEEIADSVADGRLVMLDGVAHLAPAEAPERVAALLREHLLGEQPPAPTAGLRDDVAEVIDRVLGGVLAGGPEADLDERPGLEPRGRMLVAVAAVVASGRLDALPARLLAARAQGVTDDEVREVLVTAAVHGDPAAAEAAYRIAQRVLATGDA
ncbi:MAG: alpha/beta fold hydrolase [Nocardioides sp.]